MRPALVVFVVSSAVALQVGCKDAPSSGHAAPSASSSAPSVSSVEAMSGGIPIKPEVIERTNNPTKLPVYAGPVGIVEGVVRYKGAPAPDEAVRIPEGCREARDTYGKLFRVGSDGALADVIVGVTGYDAYVPPRPSPRVVTVKGCAFDAKTITVTYGQRLDIANADDEAYLPHLVGAKAPALMVAMPHLAPVKVYPPEIGRYLLTDDLKHPWMKADVYVFKFSTHGVTSLDGRFRIEGVPVGHLTVAAQHPIIPSIPGTAEKAVDVKAGETTRVELTIEPPVVPAAPSSAPAKGKKPPEKAIP